MRASGTMSKKRYHELLTRMNEELGAKTAATALRMVCEVLRFDPSLPQYTPEAGRRSMASRAARAAELGVSVSKLVKKGVAWIESDRERAMAQQTASLAPGLKG